MRQTRWRISSPVLIAICFLLVGFVDSTIFSQTAPSPPRLVLVLAIDQMRFDYLTRFDPLYQGGLRMLLDRGAVFTNARYRHAATETGPGHSVILSGRHPSHSGIVANDWYDAYLAKPVNVVEDLVQNPLGGAGRSASPVHALGFTVGDVLRTNSPGSKVVSIAQKDRSAILLGGRRADAAYWYETAGGNFITSTYYMREAPRWLLAWNERRLADQYAGKQWTRLLLDTALYEQYAGKDAVEGEWDRKDTVFPHVVRGNPPAVLFYDDLRRTPFSDDLTVDVAMEAMKAHQIGKDALTDIFAIAFAATDVIGHTYGPDSHEIMDQLLRLDVVLGKVLTEIDATVGLANTLVVLTADHGVAPLVENLQARGFEARRGAPALLQTAVKEAFDKRFPGSDNLIAHYAPPDFYLNKDVIRNYGLDRKDVEDTAIAALLATGLVARVYTHGDLSSAKPSSDPFLPLFQNGFYEPRSPQLTVLLKPHVYLSGMPGGTGHGTAYDYDRHVPIIFMGRGIASGLYDAPSGPEDIAPTIARILSLPFQVEHDARLLVEMLSGK